MARNTLNMLFIVVSITNEKAKNEKGTIVGNEKRKKREQMKKN